MKMCVCFFILLLTTVFGASENRYDYDMDASMQTYEQVCVNTQDLSRTINIRWRVSANRDCESKLYFESGDYYYIKEGLATWVVDKHGVCIATFIPYFASALDLENLKRVVFEDSVTRGWRQMDNLNICSPRLEKISDDEYIVTKLDCTYTPECNGKAVMFRSICAYIKGDKVLICFNRSSIGIGLRICQEPAFSAWTFREEQLYALRRLYEFYFLKKISGKELNDEAKRRLTLLDKMRDKESDWTVDKQWMAWHNSHMSGNGSFMQEFWVYRGNYGIRISGALKLPELSEKVVWPNVNVGVWTKGIAAKLRKLTGDTWHEVSTDGGENSYTALLHNEKRDVGVRVMLYHHYSVAAAREWVLSMCAYEPDLEDRKFGMVGTPFNSKLSQRETVEDLVSMLKVNPGWVGDMDFCFHPLVDDWGVAVEGSEKRAVYFVRGNTGVAVFADKAEYDVLPIARAIDADLVKGMNNKAK